MKDQVESLPPSLRARSALINSTLTPDEQRRALDAIAEGAMKLVYAAPERLRQPSFLRALRQAGVSLVVVDEAHCLSLWGHDFRPDYLSIPAALPEIGDPSLLAMTATATPETAASLSGAFHRELEVVRTSAFRPNLFYAAERLGSKEEKARRVVALCRELRGTGIVYVSSRRDADNLAGVLRDHGVSAVSYHAGLEPRQRAVNQDRFMSGAARVVVATVAFGMGVDKPDVRMVVHINMPGSLDAYYQESGRAGRDGDIARCVLLYTPSDRRTHQFFMRRRYSSPAAVLAIARALEESAPVALPELATRANASPRRAEAIIAALEEAGAVRRLRDRRVRPVSPHLVATAEHLIETYAELQAAEREKLDQMIVYSQTALCRWRKLLEYFDGATSLEHCGHCDRCVERQERGDRNQELGTGI
jgi:ATP-dependent DNA helicase RecQ